MRPRSGNVHRELSHTRADIISHWSYPKKHYPNKIDSSIQITGLQTNQEVIITFSYFKLFFWKGRSGCQQDYLEISGLSSGSRRYCNNPDYTPLLSQPISLRSLSGTVTFRFVTNYIYTGHGFRFNCAGMLLIV